MRWQYYKMQNVLQTHINTFLKQIQYFKNHPNMNGIKYELDIERIANVNHS